MITDTPVQQMASGRVPVCMSEGAAEAAYDDMCYFKRLDKFECELQDCLTNFVKEYEASLATLNANNNTISGDSVDGGGVGRATGTVSSLLVPTQRPQRKRKTITTTTIESSKPKQKQRKRESTYYDYIGNVSNTSTSASSCIDDDDDYFDDDDVDDESSFGTISPLPSSCTDDDYDEETEKTNKNW